MSFQYFLYFLFGTVSKLFHRRMLNVLLSLCILSVLSACDQPSNTGENKAQQNKMSVLILVPQNPDTDAWSSEGRQGAERIKTQLNADVTLVPNSDPNNIKGDELYDMIRPNIEDGVRVVIGLGGQYEAFLRQLADRYTHTSVALVGEVQGNNRNFGGAAGRFDDIGYVMGTLASQQLKPDGEASQKVAFLGGIPFKTYQGMAESYKRGVQGQNTSVDVLVDWVGSFANEQLALKKAKVILDQGVRVLFINTGMGNQAIVQLIKQYPDRKLLVIDTEARDDWNPNQVIATGIMDIAGIITQATHQVSLGHWRGEQVWFSFEENVAQVKLNKVLVNDKNKAQIDQVISQLKGGHLNRDSSAEQE